MTPCVTNLSFQASFGISLSYVHEQVHVVHCSIPSVNHSVHECYCKANIAMRVCRRQMWIATNDGEEKNMRVTPHTERWKRATQGDMGRLVFEQQYHAGVIKS